MSLSNIYLHLISNNSRSFDNLAIPITGYLMALWNYSRSLLRRFYLKNGCK
jgi:hypothetical protein